MSRPKVPLNIPENTIITSFLPKKNSHTYFFGHTQKKEFIPVIKTCLQSLRNPKNGFPLQDIYQGVGFLL